MRLRDIGLIVTALVLSAAPVMAGPDGSGDMFNVPVSGFNQFGAVDLGSCSCNVTPIFGGAVGQFGIALQARLSGASAAGISGAELYVDGLEKANTVPAGNGQISNDWSLLFNPAPGLTILGNLFAPHLQGTDVNRRGNLTWSVPDGYLDANCQKATLVYFGRIEATNSTSGTALGGPNPTNHYVKVIAANPPTNPSFTAPTLINCNYPTFAPAILVSGGQFIINPTGASIEAACSVAVSANTWGGVKNLYR